MKRILLISFLFISFLAKAQQYTNFQGYGFKANRIWADSVSIQPSDTVRNKVAKSVAILNNKLYVADGTKWIIAGGGAVDTFSLSTRAWRQKGIDSVQANLTTGLSTKLNIADTSSMLTNYSRLKSVGLTMPSAFSVANSPLTSNGTLAVTGAGTSAQYVRGDGQLANFPSNNGGGSSVNYYLNGSVNQGTFGGSIYYQMSKTPILGAGTNFTRTNGQGNGYIASFITDAADPSLLNIPAGNWNLEFYFQSSASGGSPQFYGEIYKVSSSNVFTLVASGSANPEGITNGTTVDQYFTSISVPQTALLLSDRLAIRIYVITSGRTITLHTENSNLCEVLTTFSTGLNALNGLTSQVQYLATGTSGTDFAISSAADTHTFNLPTASATNRGALSSANWTTFNSKIGAGDTATMLTPYTRGSGTSGQVAYWNATRSLTGSSGFTFTPTTSLLLNNSVTAASAIARGQNITSTLTASANSDVLVGLDINPTFTNSSFTGVQNTSIRTFLVNNTSMLGRNGLLINDDNLASNGGYNFLAWGVSNQPARTSGIRAFWLSNNGFEQGLSFHVASGGNGALTAVVSSEAMRITNTKNVLIGTSTDAGYKLDVNGTARLLGTTFGGEINGPSNFYINGSSNGAGTIYLRPATLNVSGATIFTSSTTPQAGINVTGASNSTGANYWEIGTDANAYFINALNRSSGNYNKPAYIDAQRLILNSGSAGSVLIGTSTDIASSRLTVTSTTQGFLPPRMTTAQRDLISSPAAGLIIYNTSTNKHQGYNGTTWNDFY